MGRGYDVRILFFLHEVLSCRIVDWFTARRQKQYSPPHFPISTRFVDYVQKKDIVEKRQQIGFVLFGLSKL